MPLTRAQQFVCLCHRADAPIECRNKLCDRSTRLLRLGYDSADGRERVLYAMVELGHQQALLLLNPFALGHVNGDADNAKRASISVIGNETARLDPSQLA